MWDIYVIGDVKFLSAILNGIAMIFKGEAIWVAAKIFILLSILQLGINAVLQNSFMQVQQLAVTWLVVAALFVPRVTVTLHDRNSLLTQNVAQVPVGIAVFASFTSKFGKTIADTLGHAFTSVHEVGGQPGVTQSFEQLLALRARVLETMLTSQKQGSDLYRSWQQYLGDCTEISLALRPGINGASDTTKIFGTSLPESLALNSQVFYTQVYKVGTTQSMTCAQAFTHLKQQTLENVQQLINPLRGNVNKNMHLAQINADIVTLSNGQLDAQKYITALAMAQMLTQTPSYTQLGQAVQAQSLAQLYTQWTLQGNIFTHTVKPLLTFLEGFFYAVVPFIFLILMLGSFGYRMLGKFAMLLVWLQMWQPIITIINLYYQQAISRSLTEVQQAYIAIDSFWGISMFTQKLESYIATSGMLLSSVGSLALFLIYGGAVAATSLAGRIAPPSPAATPALAPNAVQGAPVVQAGSQYSADIYQGTRVSGAEAAVGTVNLASTLSHMQANAAQQMSAVSSGETFSTTQVATQATSVVSSAMGSIALGKDYSYSQNKSSSLSDSHVESASNNEQHSSTYQKQSSWSLSGTVGQGSGVRSSQVINPFHEDNKAVGAMSGMVGTAGMAAGEAMTSNLNSNSPMLTDYMQPAQGNTAPTAIQNTGVGTEFKARHQRSATEDQSVGAQVSTSSTRTRQHGDSTNFTQNQQSSSSQSQTSGLSNTNSQSNSAQTQQAYSLNDTYQQEYRQLAQMQASLGSRQDMSVLALAQQTLSQPGAADYLSSIVSANPQLARAAAMHERSLAPLVPDTQQRQVAAQIQALFSNEGMNSYQDRANMLWFLTYGQLPQTNILQGGVRMNPTPPTAPTPKVDPSATSAQAQSAPQQPTTAQAPSSPTSPQVPANPVAMPGAGAPTLNTNPNRAEHTPVDPEVSKSLQHFRNK
ncbi:conjugal transfer protein TraG N-terminal domain-containing protein [Psittacicella hinzii]|uniref:TraG N-terminal Proteobacteria domain-containing protein n=1 Tax=Psittacicella hinzii TaxID=2028575 RepID=A0A3A1YRH8_9GAMM|nr:conjugal transfer protein TraG N-terminal domain-containing protein [Psittacicella hinzii]RIY38627.1 hypothetical protein CKF58_03745 [Psittacicella hinzii]